MLNRSLPDDRAEEAMQHALAGVLELQRLAETARRLGHRPIGWLRSDDEYVSACSRCGARLYARLAAQTVEDGEALTDRCPSA